MTILQFGIAILFVLFVCYPKQFIAGGEHAKNVFVRYDTNGHLYAYDASKSEKHKKEKDKRKQQRQSQASE